MGNPEDPMAAEFDTLAGWTLEVALDLGPDYYVPAACRGSGSPAALRWLLGALGVGPDDRMLDIGAGLGGPAAFAMNEADARPVLCTDPAGEAVRAVRRLFDLPTVQAGTRMPFTDESFDVVWSLGVLCTVADQPAFLAELHRVLRPSGRWGLLVIVAREPESVAHPWPEGNAFPTEHRLSSMLSDAGLRVQHRIDLDRLSEPPASWPEHEAAVEAELRRRHGDDPRWGLAAEQSRRIGDLLGSGAVAGTLLVGVTG